MLPYLRCILVPRNLLPAIYILAMSVLPAVACRADGVAFGDALVISESEQIAAIACHEQGETLLLSTRFMTNTPLQNQVWIVPVFSETKPVVQALSQEFIMDLAMYIRGHELEIFEQAVQGKRMLGRVTVYDDVELEDYDLSVLKAGNGSELAEWIRGRGYAVPDSAAPLLDEYAAGDAYFIVNRLDLRNRYTRELEFLKSMGYDIIDLFSLNHEAGSLAVQFAKIKESVRLAIFADLTDPEGIAYEESVLEGYISRKEYERITETYRNGLDSPAPYNLEFWSEYEALFTRLTSFWSLLGNSLKGGYNTPIRIDFKPSQCFFPLKISSAAPDTPMTVTVAVLAHGQVHDSSDVLTTRFQNYYSGNYVTSDFHFPVQKYLGVDNDLISNFDAETIHGLDTITLIIMEARPSEFTADAWFVRPPDKFRADYEIKGGWNLVCNPFDRDLCVVDLNGLGGIFYTFDPSGDGSWNNTGCLRPCEAGFYFSERMYSSVEIEDQGADSAVCRAAFEDKTGWRLVARPGLIDPARIRFGPYFMSAVTKKFSLQKDDIPGSGYWLYLDN